MAKSRRVSTDRWGTDELVVVLSDVLRPGLDVVFCGTAAGTRSAEVGAYYAGPGNLFWPTLHEVGLTPRRFAPSEYEELLDLDIGLTDVCKTRSGSDRAIGEDAYDVKRLAKAIKRYSPRVLAFNGKRAAEAALGEKRVYGLQDDTLAGALLFVCPSTSGRASRYWNLGYWRELADLVRSLET